MGKDTTQQELVILSEKLAESERRLQLAEETIKRQAGAIIDVDYKVFHSMKQLLTANDVFKTAMGHDPMRVNILEIMNDLRRFAKSKFENAGIMAYAEVDNDGRTDGQATPVTDEVQFARTGNAARVFTSNVFSRERAD